MSQDRGIEDYIRQNRSAYTREAITNNLLAMGHSQEDIDNKWAMVDASDIPPERSSHTSSRHKVAIVLGRLALALVAVLIIVVFMVIVIIGSCISSGGMH